MGRREVGKWVDTHFDMQREVTAAGISLSLR